MNPFAHVMNDTIAIVLKNGDRYENIRAVVNPSNIICTEVTIPLAADDIIERSLPSGKTEILIVSDVHLTRGQGGIPDFYSIDYKRASARRHSDQSATVNVHIEGSPQSHVNVNSTDHSTNVIDSQSRDVFLEIRDLLKDAVSDSNELELLLERVADMENSVGSNKFVKAYQDFIDAAAAHMTVLAPALPLLAALLTSSGG